MKSYLKCSFIYLLLGKAVAEGIAHQFEFKNISYGGVSHSAVPRPAASALPRNLSETLGVGQQAVIFKKFSLPGNSDVC